MGIPVAPAPTRLGRYELLARLATGGMGEIFLARLEGAAGFEKLVVVKRILPHLADDARFRQMLIAEARLASKLNHANICQVIELGETEGQLYIVMEYLDGVTLLPLLRKSSKAQTMLDFGLIGGIFQQATDALHYAHELHDRGGESIGIVHRDMTPSNIFLTESGVVKVLDFGIAKVKDAASNTQTGTVKGKYAYMAPEQLKGGILDRRADIFALGVVVFEMLALRRLFQRKTDYLTFRAVMEQPIPDVRRYRPDTPDAVAAVLCQALDRDPHKRFATARQFGTALLDACAPLGRIWTQGDISDFVRREFLDDLGRRSSQVASAISKTEAGQRKTMPLIVPDDPPDDDDDDDAEFPPVEDTVTETPPQFKAVRPPQDGREFNGTSTGQVTPPPFGLETSSSGVGLMPLPPAQAQAMPQAQMIAAKPRSLMWPLLAISMIGIAGAALFLVWKQTQQQQPGGTITIQTQDRTDEGARTPDAGTGPVAVGSADARQGSADGSADPGTKPGDPKRPPDPKGPKGPKGPASPEEEFQRALGAQRGALNRCAQQHGAPPPGARLVIDVSARGRARKVAIEPAEVNATPLGACIKNVLSAAAFPTGSERTVSVSLNSKTS